MDNVSPAKRMLGTALAGAAEPIVFGALMENAKMEKQRTGASYRRILPMFTSRGASGILAGVFPWGVAIGMTEIAVDNAVVDCGGVS